MNQILTARWVLPITSAPIPHGYVCISKGVIREVGAKANLAAGARVVDLGDVVLMPGLINTHTHLELACYAGAIAPQPLWTWLGQLIQLRNAPGREAREQNAVIEGAWQSLRAGVTTVADISRTGDACRALAQVPIRKVCFVELLSLALQPPRDVTELRRAIEEAQNACHDPLLCVGVSPHAPYTVYRDDFHAACKLADAHGGIPWTAHFAETREEVRWLCGDAAAIPEPLGGLMRAKELHSPRLVRAVDYLRWPGSNPRRGIFAHCNYVSTDELIDLAGSTVVYCPRAHSFFGHDPHPFRAMMDAGINVTLGTDSLASNQSLSLLDEARYVKRLPEPPCDKKLLEMISVDAARALGRTDLGSLEIGKIADLVAFPIASLAQGPYASVLSAERADRVWISGEEIAME